MLIHHFNDIPLSEVVVGGSWDRGNGVRNGGNGVRNVDLYKVEQATSLCKALGLLVQAAEEHLDSENSFAPNAQAPLRTRRRLWQVACWGNPDTSVATIPCARESWCLHR